MQKIELNNTIGNISQGELQKALLEVRQMTSSKVNVYIADNLNPNQSIMQSVLDNLSSQPKSVIGITPIELFSELSVNDLTILKDNTMYQILIQSYPNHILELNESFATNLLTHLDTDGMSEDGINSIKSILITKGLPLN